MVVYIESDVTKTNTMNISKEKHESLCTIL